MSTPKIEPEKITDPMQLMAAWFVMLVLLVTVLLGAAANISEPDWAAGYLVISATILICIVICCVFLMLTKYRPNLQNSEKYAVWIKDQNKFVEVATPERVSHKEKLPSLELSSDLTPKEQINQFKLLRACDVTVVNSEYSHLILQDLLKVGFSASVYERDIFKVTNELCESTGVWVGEDLHPKAALMAIEIALGYWPQLTYLHLSCDSEGAPMETHEQLFIGGANSAVKRLGLLPWSKEEITSIPKNISQQDFHKLIREKYS
ncbi:MAG: hypothetical protein ACI843_002336 [Psychrobacter glaciei]|jgi:hypothetical protein